MKSLIKEIVLCATVFLLLTSVSAGDYPLMKLKWTFPVQSNGVYAFDFDRDGEIEVYSSKLDVVRSYLYVIDLDGNLLYKTWVDKVAKRKLIGCGAPERHAQEKIMYFMPANLDNDKNLDLIAGSSMKGTALVEERVYYFEMDESPLTTYNTRYRWDYIMGDIPSEVIALGRRVAVASLDSHVYVLDLYGNVVENYGFDSAVWDMEPKSKSSLEGAVFATFKGIYTVEEGGVKPLLPTGERVFKVDVGDVNLDDMDEVVALTESGRFIMVDRNSNIIWEEDIEGPVDVRILEFRSDNFARTLIAADRIIYSVDERGNLNIEQVLADHINSMYAFTTEGETRYVVVGSSKQVYLFEINPDFSVYSDGKYYLKNARSYYLIEKNCVKAVGYADKCRKLFMDIGYDEGALKCYLITSECGSIVPDVNKSVKAEEFYRGAENLSEEGKYETALAYAEMSLDLFLDAGDDAGILRADFLIQEIRGVWEAKAKGLYLSALDSFEARDYSNAIFYAEEAQIIYGKLNNNLGEINNAIIISKAKTGISANKSLSKAEYYFRNKSFNNATVYAELAVRDYASLGYEAELRRAGYILNTSLRYMDAENYFGIAQEYLLSEDLGNATIYADKSLEVYKEIGDEEGIRECAELLETINYLLNKDDGDDSNLYFFAAAIILVALSGLVHYLIKRRRKPKSKPPDNKRGGL